MNPEAITATIKHRPKKSDVQMVEIGGNSNSSCVYRSHLFLNEIVFRSMKKFLFRLFSPLSLPMARGEHSLHRGPCLIPFTPIESLRVARFSSNVLPDLYFGFYLLPGVECSYHLVLLCRKAGPVSDYLPWKRNLAI